MANKAKANKAKEEKKKPYRVAKKTYNYKELRNMSESELKSVKKLLRDNVTRNIRKIKRAGFTDTPAIISSFRPTCPVYAITKSEEKFNQMGLFFGICPKLYKGEKEETPQIIVESLNTLKNEGILEQDDLVVIAGGKYTYEKTNAEVNKGIGGIYKI